MWSTRWYIRQDVRDRNSDPNKPVDGWKGEIFKRGTSIYDSKLESIPIRGHRGGAHVGHPFSGAIAPSHDTPHARVHSQWSSPADGPVVVGADDELGSGLALARSRRAGRFFKRYL